MQTVHWLLPLCVVLLRVDDKAMGTWTRTSCNGTWRFFVDGSTRGGPQMLLVSLVPGVSSTSPWDSQSVWVRHLIVLDSTSEKVPLVHCLQRTSCVGSPRLFTPNPGGHSECGEHLESISADRKLWGGQAQTRSCVAVQGTLSTKPAAAHGGRHRWHCTTPFSLRVKVPAGQGLHSRSATSVQCMDT